VTLIRVAAATLACALLSTGCGYHIVRNSDAIALRVAQDSATISALQQELAALQRRSRADSIRLATELAIQANNAAAAALVPAPQTAASDSVLKARTAEVATLKEQLAKVSTELDRIKRRLANPRP
jgi:hypothetical protein